MSCLLDYIGIKGFHAAPESGQYINQLPGISLQSMQAISDKEQVTFAGTWADVQARAWRRLATDVRARLRARYRLKSGLGILRTITTPEGSTTPASAHYRGLLLDSGVSGNGFFAFHITSLHIDLPAASGAVALHVFDSSGNELGSYQIADSEAGINSVQVNTTFAASVLFIAVDATGLELNNTSVIHAYDCIDGFYPTISGAEAMTATPWAYGTTNSTYGISAVAMPICDYSSIVCRHKEEFTTAWINLLGAEFMLERMYSTRINRFTTVEAAQAEELRDLYTGQYEDALDEAIAGIRISHEDGCVECSQAVTRVERLP
jgi:hypothetical protein